MNTSCLKGGGKDEGDRKKGRAWKRGIRQMTKENLSEIASKVDRDIRLTKEDGMCLINSDDIISLGQLANKVREKKSGKYVFFNVNRHINLTNICVSRCKFCAFSRDKSDSDAYAMTIDDVLEIALSARNLGITEFHIVSGLHPDLPFDYYLEVIFDEFVQIGYFVFVPERIKAFEV